MSVRSSYKHTMAAAYIGYITQAIVNNFAPLLFLTFSNSWNIPLSRMAILVSVNFGIQLTVDLICAGLGDRLGYRPFIVLAHILAGTGLVGLGIFPRIFSDPYIGIILAIAIYAIGGGLTEVLISPIAEACPTTNKESQMSLLHSFYCWGHVFVILASTAFFFIFGIENWWILACIWAIIPFFNAIYFSIVPIRTLRDDVESGEVISLGQLLRRPLFWLFIVMMFCAGAGEQAMSQWASAFAEAGLGVSKTIGDLAGPCMFAVFMGLSRLISSRISCHLPTEVFMALCCGLCILSYLLAALSPWPVFSLVGCGLCGFSVGIFWPGTFSLAAIALKGGGTALFALLALSGDLGCMGGPAFVSLMTETISSGSLKGAMFFAMIFPIGLISGLVGIRRGRKNHHSPTRI